MEDKKNLFNIADNSNDTGDWDIELPVILPVEEPTVVQSKQQTHVTPLGKKNDPIKKEKRRKTHLGY